LFLIRGFMVEIANKVAQLDKSATKGQGSDLQGSKLDHCRNLDDIRRELGRGPSAWEPLSRHSTITLPSEVKPLPSAQPANPDLDKTLDKTMRRILAVGEISSSLSNKVGGDYATHAVQQVLANLSPEERKRFESYIDTLVRRDEINNSNIDIRMPEVSEQQLKLVETIKQRAGVVLDKAVAAVNSTMSEADKSALLKEKAEYSKQIQAYKDAKEAGIDMAHPKVGPLQDQFDKRMYQAIKTASNVEASTAGQIETPTAGQKIQIGSPFGTVL
jgi:hypothetical protein